MCQLAASTTAAARTVTMWADVLTADGVMFQQDCGVSSASDSLSAKAASSLLRKKKPYKSQVVRRISDLNQYQVLARKGQ